MDQRQARRVLAEAARRAERTTRLDAKKLFFGPQLDFIQDESRYKAAVCSRRAGKSHGIAGDMVVTAYDYNDAFIPYITQTKTSGSARATWSKLMVMSREYNLGLKFNANAKTVTVPETGTQIFFTGADDLAEIERLRGPSYPKVYLDEAQSFRPFLEYLIQDILEPATLDYDGQIIMTGTPNASCAGFFHDATNKAGSGWTVHKWTLLDNPYLPEPRKFLQRLKRKYHWDDNHPTYLREYCGVWIRDENSLVYPLKEYNVIEDWSSDGDWEYVLGVDLGYSTSSAFVLLAYSEQQRRVVAVDCQKHSKLISSAVAAKIDEYRQTWPISDIVIDAGGLGKMFVEEMRQRYEIPAKPAEKRAKAAFIELLNSDLRAGTLQLYKPGTRELKHELDLLQWNEDRTEPDKARYEDHAADAMLYGWRQCLQYLHESEYEDPTPGTKAYWDKIEDEMEQAAEKRWAGEDEQEPWWLEL